jgi:hypothetical protein
LDIWSIIDESTRLSRNVDLQTPNDAVSHPRRTENLTKTLRNPELSRTLDKVLRARWKLDAPFRSRSTEEIFAYSRFGTTAPRALMASLTTDAHFSLSTAFFCHLLTLISSRNFLTSSSHQNLGLSILLLPAGLLSNIFLNALP